MSKSDLVLDRSTFHYGFNAAKKSMVPEIWSVEVDAFSTFIRKFEVQNELIFVLFGS